MNKKLILILAIVAAGSLAYFLLFSKSVPSQSLNETKNIDATEKTKASPFGGHVHALAINPETNELFLGARLIYRSADGGKSWIKVDPNAIPKSQERANITSITIDPRNPKIMYATGHGIAVIQSVDEGKTWARKDNGLGSGERHDSTESFTIDAIDSKKLYVWIMDDGVYRSKDAGESWQRVDDGPRGQEIRSLTSINLPTGMGGIWLYAGLDNGIMKSPDCFCGWDKIPNNGLPPDKRVYSVAADLNYPKTLYAGLQEGIFKTEDAGVTWKKVYGEVEDAVIAIHPKNSQIVYAASSDGKIFTSNDGGATWQLVK